jgi:hypothetical protein
VALYTDLAPFYLIECGSRNVQLKLPVSRTTWTVLSLIPHSIIALYMPDALRACRDQAPCESRDHGKVSKSV